MWCFVYFCSLRWEGGVLLWLLLWSTLFGFRFHICMHTYWIVITPTNVIVSAKTTTLAIVTIYTHKYARIKSMILHYKCVCVACNHFRVIDFIDQLYACEFHSILMLIHSHTQFSSIHYALNGAMYDFIEYIRKQLNCGLHTDATLAKPHIKYKRKETVLSEWVARESNQEMEDMDGFSLVSLRYKRNCQVRWSKINSLLFAHIYRHLFLHIMICALVLSFGCHCRCCRFHCIGGATHFENAFVCRI